MFKLKIDKVNPTNVVRIVFYEKTLKKYTHKFFLSNPLPSHYIIREKAILNNIQKYRFKLQEQNNEKWQDLTKLKEIVNLKDFGNYLTNKYKIVPQDVMNFVTLFSYSKTPSLRVPFIQAIKACIDNIWLNTSNNHSHVYDFLSILNQNKEKLNDEWLNIRDYLKYILVFKKKFHEKGYSSLFYPDVIKKLSNDTEMINFIEDLTTKLELENSQFTLLLAAQLQSLLSKRKVAKEFFKKVLDYDNNLEKEFLLGQGTSTYTDSIYEGEMNSNIQFFNNPNNDQTNLTILVSVESNFLKRYAPQLFYSIIALEKYHLHFHVVGEEINLDENINDAINLFHTLNSYIGKSSTITMPTFSYEKMPSYVDDIKAFSATSRFINAKYFMEKYNTDFLIIDADMFILDNLNLYYTSAKKSDVTVAFSRGVTTIVPWRRVMAGNIFLKNNEKSKFFIDKVGRYLIENLSNKNPWTIDQNALSYAFEETNKAFEDVKFVNLKELDLRPFVHPKLRTYIQRN